MRASLLSTSRGKAWLPEGEAKTEKGMKTKAVIAMMAFIVAEFCEINDEVSYSEVFKTK